MLMSEIKEDSMTDHVEMVIEARYVGKAQAIFDVGTPHQFLHIFGDHKVVNVYKEDPKGAVIVKFVTAGQEFYPAQLLENITTGAGPTLLKRNLDLRSPSGETIVVPVIHPKHLLYQRLASFQFMPETTTEEKRAKREMLQQINVCLAEAAGTAQISLPAVGRFNIAQAPELREYVLDLIAFSRLRGPRVMHDQIEQWRAVGVDMFDTDLPSQVGNDDQAPEIWHTAQDGL